MRVYRLNVRSWPTPDGQPWARWYGNGAREGQPGHVPDWLQERVWEARAKIHVAMTKDPTGFLLGGAPLARMGVHEAYLLLEGVREEQNGLATAICCPPTRRRNFLSASGAYTLCYRYRAFGAEVDVVASESVQWGSM